MELEVPLFLLEEESSLLESNTSLFSFSSLEEGSSLLNLNASGLELGEGPCVCGAVLVFSAFKVDASEKGNAVELNESLLLC